MSSQAVCQADRFGFTFLSSASDMSSQVVMPEWGKGLSLHHG